MKKIGIYFVLFALILSGCGAVDTVETVADDIVAPVVAQVREIYLELPPEAASPTVESGADRMYQCGSYEIYVQTLEGGDLEKTVRTLSGYEKNSLTVMQTLKDGYDCYEFVWTSAGESGEMVGRAMVLDDGSYHYCVSVLGDAAQAAENQVYWLDLFESFTLS